MADSDSSRREESQHGRGTRNAENADDPQLCAGVVTISTDRTLESDAAGGAIVTALKKGGHEVATREHVGADLDRVQGTVSRLIDRDDVDIVVTAGATSVEPDDIAIEAIRPLLGKELPAFADVFTSLSFDNVGTRVIAARPLAGVADGVPVFCLPGDEDAARLGAEEIILPEVTHLVSLAREELEETRWTSDDEGADANGAVDTDNADAETTDHENGEH
ncbi:molybdenum cofactor biosynthesis protein B [Natronorubrum sediminis]|uniref:Molybdenum cofactor biosynthesis protein B n=1 Tax=Natronorubrum sediminis TaxID=640943 RepID=A0A1H6FS96_9EURY|nr:molybdopterin-binding protein [Natronorubrum sediminis]SEH12634.1 molybdenum cofactor biosynthesis protein B [Natronorubrum sediminis]